MLLSEIFIAKLQELMLMTDESFYLHTFVIYSYYFMYTENHVRPRIFHGVSD